MTVPALNRERGSDELHSSLSLSLCQAREAIALSFAREQMPASAMTDESPELSPSSSPTRRRDKPFQNENLREKKAIFRRIQYCKRCIVSAQTC